MTNKTFRLKGHLTTLTQIHIVPPGTPEVTITGEKVKQISHEVIWRDGARIEVPCIPSSTMRGALRRAATDLAYDLGGSGDKPKLDDYLYNAVGGVKGNEKEDLGEINARAARRAANPIIALYGAATPWDRSRALISSAYADPEIYQTAVPTAERIGSRRSDDMIARPGLESLLGGDALADWEAMRGATKENKAVSDKIKKLRSQARGANEVDKKAFYDQIEELEGKKSGTNSLLRPLHHAAMPRGVELAQDITLKDVSPAEAGLFFASIDHMWSVAPEFGGKIAHGYGLVRASWELFEKVDGTFVSRGMLTAEPHVGLEDATPVAEEIAAWAEYRESGAMNLKAGIS
ncbi:hypothetical protein KUV57_12400 [Epibacterium sp. DP7N7-1]|nr:hypothetical protein [Epibacterium sp. DP7N7-1]